MYSWSTSNVSLGATKDSISGWTTDYATLNKTFFLKHNIGSDNTVESQEVCYILNGNQYCLKGGDNVENLILNIRKYKNYKKQHSKDELYLADILK